MVTAFADLLPWYERGPDGTATGRDWATERQAHDEAGPECTVHQETSDRVGPLTWALGEFVAYVPRPVRHWKPRGFGGVE
ncbi:hypothetical protein [Saccharothrix sp. HUAS TT1]|uniref:hypothetical protein n=1 Tax=unclassified Saccharothrix TaxID=2593673 RepID=UPI00345C08A7